MPQSSRRTFRILVSILAVITAVILGFIGVVLALNRPPSSAEIAATLAALPSPTRMAAPSPTPVPTLPGVTEALLVCQREAGQAMVARSMVGAVNLSGNHLFLLKWVSLAWPVEDLNDALAGVIMGFDVALDVWDQGCAVYDRVQIDVYDQRGDQQAHRLSVQAQMDDLLRWKAGGLSDSGLIARLEIARDTGQ